MASTIEEVFFKDMDDAVRSLHILMMKEEGLSGDVIEKRGMWGVGW